MNDQPSDNAHVEQEPKPSLLATLSLILGLVPWVMEGQVFLVDRMFWLPRWLRGELTIGTHVVIVMLVGAVSSLICGLLALADMKWDKTTSGKWKAVTGIALAGCFGVFAVKMMLLPNGPGMRASEVARSRNCPANLKAISTALTMYADDHQGQMPATLAELANGTYLPIGSTATRCPKDKTRYVYPGAGGIWRTNGTEVTVYCVGDHLGKRNVLFNDGRAATVSPAELEKLLAEQEKDGQSGR